MVRDGYEFYLSLSCLGLPHSRGCLLVGFPLHRGCLLIRVVIVPHCKGLLHCRGLPHDNGSLLMGIPLWLGIAS